MKTDNFEIERRLLIKYPDIAMLNSRATMSEIEQTYLLSAKGETARLRKRGLNGVYTYTHTVKTRISDMKRLELEREISEREYLERLAQADPSRNVILKRRYCLDYKDQMFEIDLFPFWQDRAIMEIELQSEQQEVEFPPDIEIIREVTNDKRYTNSSMARKIPYEEI